MIVNMSDFAEIIEKFEDFTDRVGIQRLAEE